MARRTVENILDLVEGHHDATTSLRARMDTDHQLYRLNPYDAGDGFQSYTSNEPQTYADKIISWLSSADTIIRIPPAGNPRNNREVNNDKERFLIGALKSANERLSSRLLPDLQSQLAWYITLRGWYAGRALLVKRDEDTTFIDITPWDPMHTYWGTDADGLSWACYKTKKTQGEIESQYNVRLGSDRDDADGIDVYDFYDREDNFVAVPNRFIKKRTRHTPEDDSACGTVPVFLGPVGANPLIQSLEWSSIEDTYEDYGESVFKSTRDLYESHNFMMSVMLELTARSRKQGLKIISRDGQKTLEEDPYKEGTEISLAQGEDVQPLGLMEVARETGAYMGMVSGEIQRGSIPHSVYGELQFQLSGFAINTLKQGVETVLSPRVIALEQASLRPVFQWRVHRNGAFRQGQQSNVLLRDHHPGPSERGRGHRSLGCGPAAPGRYGQVLYGPDRQGGSHPVAAGSVDSGQRAGRSGRGPDRGRRQGTDRGADAARGRHLEPVSSLDETGPG